MDKNELKVQALLEKISNMTAQYENQIADLRVALTISEMEREQLEAANRDKEENAKKED